MSQIFYVGSMSNYCKYHPKQKAAWFCQHCEVLFCNGCVPEDQNNFSPKCTLCRKSLQSLSVSDRIPPFWQNLSMLLSMPLTKGVLLFVATFAALFSVLPGGLIGAGIALIALIPVFELIFDSMEKVASGEKLETQASKYIKFQVKSQSIKLLSGYFLAIVIVIKIYAINPGFGALLSMFLILGVPASMIILMMEKSVLAMLNPIKIGFIMRQFKGAYFLLFALMLAVVYLAVSFNHFAGQSANSFIALFLVYSVMLYLITTVAVLAGYLVYQFHHELNFTINRQSLHGVDQIKRDEMAEINIFIQEGRYEEAQRLLLDRIDQNAADYRANEKLILLYAIQGKEAFVRKIGDQYFEQMIQLKKQKQAADFYHKLFVKSIAFTPDSIDVIIGLVSEMRNKDRFKMALFLIEDFLKDRKSVKNWEELYLIQAQLLTEFANRSSEAIAVLKYIINRSVNQDMMQRAEDYLKAIA